MKVLPRSSHPISRKCISRHALDVMYRLTRKGHRALLVGGGVRDLLISREPNAFDIATSARPYTVRKLFRNSIVIGRRFKLVHVLFGKQFVEVATFRKYSEYTEENANSTFGNPRDDAFCRDFTVNSLFYDIRNFNVIDYTGGLKDIAGQKVRIIGDPQERLEEDPVRMIRGARLAAQIDFTIDDGTFSSMQKNAALLQDASESRLSYEIRKTFQCGNTSGGVRYLYEAGLLKQIFPHLDADLRKAGRKTEQDVWHCLSELDRLSDEDGFTPSFVLVSATLLMPLLLHSVPDFWNSKYPVYKLCDNIRSHISRWIRGVKINAGERSKIAEIFTIQRRFAFVNTKNFSRRKFIRTDYFRDALDLFRIYTLHSRRWQEIPDIWDKARCSRLELKDLKHEINRVK